MHKRLLRIDVAQLPQPLLVDDVGLADVHQAEDTVAGLETRHVGADFD